jgi:23S rRNA pseudouridine955/2504/2580 synthase
MMALMSEILVTRAENGLTTLEVLSRHVPAAPASYLRQLLRQGKVRRLEVPLHAATIVRTGDRLLLPAGRRLTELLQASESQRVEVLLETDQWLVVDKPTGIAVHRGVGHELDNLTDRVQQWLTAQGAPFRVSPVHRLDAGTSGPVLFAKGRRAAGVLGRTFMQAGVEKTYLALTGGELPDQGILTSPVPAKGRLKDAATLFQVLARSPWLILLKLELLSGRTHQIRRQLADAGHPLAGDRRYGGPRLLGLDRPFLHCSRLAWHDPFGAGRVAVESPLSEDLQTVLARHGLAPPGQTAE